MSLSNCAKPARMVSSNLPSGFESIGSVTETTRTFCFKRVALMLKWSPTLRAKRSTFQTRSCSDLQLAFRRRVDWLRHGDHAHILLQEGCFDVEVVADVARQAIHFPDKKLFRSATCLPASSRLAPSRRPRAHSATRGLL